MTPSAPTPQPTVAADLKWLSIIGIGEDGVQGLTAAARAKLLGAKAVFGGSRHLALAASLTSGETIEWPRPIRSAIPAIEQMRGSPIAVLVSGDPFLHGMGSVLAETIDPREFDVFPVASSFSLAAARLGWALQDTDTHSLCGHPPETLIPLLQPRRRMFVLSADESTPQTVAHLLTDRGFGASRVTVLEALDGPNERIRHCRADGFELENIARLNLMALDISAAADAQILPCVPGLDDACFSHDGMLTKREVRAVTLSSLAPRAGELLWDIGTGSGSIAIEWLLAHPANRAIALERDPDRVARARQNALSLGVPHLDVVTGEAPAACAALPVPDAVFIGGGLTAEGVFETAWQRLRKGGRLVANSVTLESDAVLSQAVDQTGGTLSRISVERLDNLGRMRGFRPAMTVTQLTAVKS